jgi:hypothetical protein
MALALQQPSNNDNSQPAGPDYFLRVIHYPFYQFHQFLFRKPNLPIKLLSAGTADFGFRFVFLLFDCFF